MNDIAPDPLQPISQERVKIRSWLNKNSGLTVQEVSKVDNLIKKYFLELKRLKAMGGQKSDKKILARQHKLSNSFSTVVYAVVVSLVSIDKNRRRKKKLELYSGMTFAQLEKLAQDAKFKSILWGKVRSFQKKKADGSMRTIFAPDIIRKARAKIAENFVLCLAEPNPYEYRRPKRGSHAAVRVVGDSISKSYYLWAVIDIKNAYPSVLRRHIEQLAIISARAIRALCPLVKLTAPNEAVQPFLLQGSPSSPTIMSAVVGQGLQPLAGEDLVLMSYEDDILTGARTMGELTKAIKALKNSFENHSAGPLHLKIKRIDLRKNGIINYLGYAISLDGTSKEIRVRPSVMAFSKFKKQMADRLQVSFDKTGSTEVLNDVANSYANKWRNSFSEWKQKAAAADIFWATVEGVKADFLLAGCDKTKMPKESFHHS